MIILLTFFQSFNRYIAGLLLYIIHIPSKVFNMFPKDQPIEILTLINNHEKLLIFIRMFKNLSKQNHLQSHMSWLQKEYSFPPFLLLKKKQSKLELTLTNPVRRSRFKCRFLISPNSPKEFCRSSSCASSCTPVTRIIHPSTAANMKHKFYNSLSSEK